MAHASIQTTLNIYTHVVDASHRAAIESSNSGCSQLFPNLKKRTGDQRPQVLIGMSPRKRLRPQASAGGKS